MKSIRLKNIKSFIDSGDIEIKPITVIVGKNSSGKSSLIRFPAVLSQTAMSDNDSPIKLYGKMVDYGNFDDVIHKGSDTNMSFELEYSINVAPRKYSRERVSLVRFTDKISKNESDIRDVKVNVFLDRVDNKISVEVVELYIEDKCIYYISRVKKDTYCFYANYKYVEGKFIEESHSIDIDNVVFEKFFPCYNERDFIKSIYSSIYKGQEIDEEKINRLLEIAYNNGLEDMQGYLEGEKTFINMWEQFNYMSNLMSRVYEKFIKESQYIRYIGPFRADPERYYRDLEYISSSVGVHGENTSNILFRDSRKESKLIKNISEWTKKVLGYEVILKDISNGLFQIMLRDQMGRETNLIDNGYGVSQVLPIVTEVTRLNFAISRRDVREIADFMVVLEQPELHLHPAAQSELADLFVECVVNGNGKKKIIVETHSEHLIRKIQILVADKESGLSKDMVKIYYVDKDENGVAYVDEMKLMENGKFETPWKPGFFDRGYQLSRELAKAGIQE